ncbi:hypothetical protein [Wolbachia pipientis]|uniref:hypothetical protein n=1 Tax=Wolbachia pipientis TaxID=955 RepID=UPI00164ADF8D|nr:hypothetical protein [Wolbachia pipientis]
MSNSFNVGNSASFRDLIDTSRDGDVKTIKAILQEGTIDIKVNNFYEVLICIHKQL